MRNSGLIDADVDGISAWDDLTLTNEGRIEAGDDGVDAEDGLILTNSGTIDAGYWAVNAGEDADVTNAEGGELIADRAAIDVLGGAVIRNHGLIDGGYNGIYADDSLELTNTGRIEAEDHGGEAGDDAGITNSGSIRAQHDAINVDERATIVNATTGSIVSQHEDAIDLDSGTVLNYGLIRPVSGEAAIDFDDSEVAVSTITNHGTISGAVAINVALGEDEDPQAIENSAAQVVVNHGRIIGTDGTALQLGAGKDQIDIYSMDIEGLVDLGADDDTLIVRATVQNGVVYFASDPETIDMDEAPDTAIYDDMKLVVASRDSFAGMDAHVTEHALGLGKSALVPMPDATGDGLAFCEQGLGDGAWWATGSVGVFDGDGSGRLSLGRDGARAGVFLSYGRISA
ncbi:MAG: hypothetical protein GYB53_19540, partial [Rhodobacteraceae bacterium]|nr:hypothetical protein [Paracoccaceae bacterium]